MSDVIDGLKSLSLHGMASAWPEILGTARMKTLDHGAAGSSLYGVSNESCTVPRAPRPGGL
jgi:hypothetical protein